MKGLFAILLLLNIAALFFYQVWIPGRQPNELPLTVPLPASELSLQLLGEAGVPPAASDCRLIGGFARLQHAQRLLQMLRANGVVATLHVLEQQQAERYWAYLPAASSRAELETILLRLRGAGIEAWPILEGAMSNAVLLGIFESQAQLMLRIEELQLLGYAPLSGSLSQDAREFWLQLSVMEATRLAEHLGSEFSDAKHRVSDCSGVAKGS